MLSRIITSVVRQMGNTTVETPTAVWFVCQMWNTFSSAECLQPPNLTSVTTAPPPPSGQAHTYMLAWTSFYAMSGDSGTHCATSGRQQASCPRVNQDTRTLRQVGLSQTTGRTSVTAERRRNNAIEMFWITLSKCSIHSATPPQHVCLRFTNFE